MKALVKILAIGLLLVPAAWLPARAQDEVKREITQIAGDLYRFQNKFHYSVFLVTPEGVIVTDPINAAAATWLKAEIAERFGQPIRYLILSHDHADHSSGGEVFADTATVIAHENTKATILGEQRPTAVPDITFSDRMTVALGGKTVDSDVVQVQAILPALTRLGAALFAPEYSAAATDAAARELLQGLSKLGVSDADIRAKARQFGIPEDILDRIGRR